MKQGFLYILLCLFLPVIATAQQREIDSLKAALVVAQDDTAKVNTLLNLSDNYLNLDPEEANRFARQALNLSEKLKFQSGRALALKNMGKGYYWQGKLDTAIEYFGQSLRVYESLGNLDGQARVLNNMGTLNYLNGDDIKALDNFFKSLDLSEKIKDKGGIAAAYSQIANVYHNKPATTGQSLDYYVKALKISEEIDDDNTIGAAAVNLGEIYFEKGKDDSALYFYNKSLKAYQNTINIPVPLRQIGLIYAKKLEFDKAIEFEKQSYEMAQKFDSKKDMTQSMLALADVYKLKGDIPAATKAYLEVEKMAESLPAYKELNDAYQGLADVYYLRKDYGKAYNYQKKQSALADTLNNQSLSDKLAKLQGSFEIRNRQNQINLLTKDKALQDLDLRSQKLQKTFISLGLALILVIAGIILRNFIESKKVNKVLDAQKAQIETLLLNILPSEVAHELQHKGNATPRYYESVSVLFTDFKGFTRHADQMTPQEIVSELNSCFIAFDEIVDKYNLEKIKTIGDSYMCAGGIPTPDRMHPINMIKAGIEMVDHMKWRNDQRRAIGLEPWELRVGIHVGPVAAGVVGKKKYAYDIWGSTVNIASRMESNGEPGQVNISSGAYELVKEKFFCQHRGKIYAKNIGEIDMYFVEGEIRIPPVAAQTKPLPAGS